jgi:excisionase family DNA binding protein
MEIKEAEVYTVKEAAKILKVSESTINRRIKDGALTSLKTGKIRRVRGKELLEFLERSIEKQTDEKT